MPRHLRFPALLAALLFCAFSMTATEYHGRVMFGGLPLPGATLTATQGDTKVVAATGLDGTYSFPNLADGQWNVKVEMLCFASVTKDITIAFGVPTAEWELKLLPVEEIRAAAATAAPTVSTPSPQPGAVLTTSVPTASSPAPGAPAKPAAGKKGKAAALPPVNTASGFQRTDVNASSTPAPQSEAGNAVPAPSGELNNNASDSLAINGSVNNGASSQFGMSQAFGNNRRGPGSLYNGAFQLVENNSFLDAANYSTTGQNTPKAAQNLLQFGASVGGPVYIPHLIRRSNTPLVFFLAYQLIRNRTATTQPALVPTADQRAGNLGNGNIIPISLISPQALSLLRFYPLANFASSSRYNYQTAIRQTTAQDSLQSRLQKTLNRSNQMSGSFSYQNTRNTNNNLFNFLDHTNVQGMAVNVTWNHRFTQRLFMTYKLDFSRQTTNTLPFFENKENVSAEAGIIGNNQNPLNWGPPSLGFASGIASLSDTNEATNKNQTGAAGVTGYFIRSPHNFTYGADYRRQQFNALSQQNPRGSFQFTGAATGSDFGDFLTGVPDTSSIAFGNADKYFRSNIYDAYVQDDWRVTPGLTLNLGMRWEYSSPITEKYGRLVNLDIASNYSNEAPVIGYQPTGSLTSQTYPSSLVRPDRHGFAPKIGLAWRPISGSSLVVRAGYGVNFDTSVYQTIASHMAQQSPLSKSLSVQNSAADPLTLANGFNGSPLSTPNTFAIDPNFRVGYVHSWQLSIQRDLPGSLILNATYLGIKGTRSVQEFYPNSYVTATNPCITCPVGYLYMTSNGNSIRQQGNVQLRRRLHNGLTATLVYTYSKSIDDAALGGQGQGTAVIAQNWLNLSAERGLSPFDQRHLVNFTMQYTTGVGTRGGMLLDGWRGTAFKEWTITTNVTAGSGKPQTPTFFSALGGTSCTSCIRPNYTGAPLYDTNQGGLFLNPAALTMPAAGQYGNAGRNSIEGPDQFSLNASMQRTFRFRDRYNMDIRLDSTNALNHVNYTSWITQVNSLSFGTPANASQMRVVQATLRMRF